MESYILFVSTYPLVSAIIQFALLGTLGEFVARWIINRKITLAFPSHIIFWKMAVWSILAICIKFAFVGFNGFVDELVYGHYHFLPEIFSLKGTFPRAFAISFFMNLQFGPFLVLSHRWLDNLMEKQKDWQGINKGLYTLLWFWIPAHTLTFMLPREFQITLAAVWSLALGLILGLVKRPKRIEQELISECAPR